MFVSICFGDSVAFYRRVNQSCILDSSDMNARETGRTRKAVVAAFCTAERAV
jgi:hypothetical protein